MTYPLYCAIVVGVIFCANFAFGKHPRWYFYPLVYAAMLLMGYATQAEAKHHHVTPDHEVVLRFLSREVALSPSEMKYYTEKMNMHRENAIRTYAEANAMCAWYPDYSDRELAKKLFNATVTAGLSGACGLGVTGAGIAALSAMFSQYALDTYDHWGKIHSKLEWSKYHSEQYYFYKNIIEKA